MHVKKKYLTPAGESRHTPPGRVAPLCSEKIKKDTVLTRPAHRLEQAIPPRVHCRSDRIRAG